MIAVTDAWAWAGRGMVGYTRSVDGDIGGSYC